jgi:hypothetical protein
MLTEEKGERSDRCLLSSPTRPDMRVYIGRTSTIHKSELERKSRKTNT